MQKKILAVYIVLLFMGIILTGFLTLNFVRTSHLKNIEENLISNAKLISTYIEEKSAENSFQSINFSKYAQKYKKQIQSRVTFVDKNGIVLGDSEVDSENLSEVENHKYRAEVQKALEGKIGIAKRSSTVTEMDYIYVAVPIWLDNQIYGVTRLAFPLAEMQKLSCQLFQNVWIAAMCGLLVITVLGYRYIDNVIKPIQEITKVAQKFANGSFNQRVYIRSNDELSVLGDTFNMMAEKLNETISNLQDKNTKLQSILASMNEGLFAVDHSYKIILINSEALSLFHIEDQDVYGKHILEVVRNNPLHDILKDILGNKNIGQTEITIDYPEKKVLRIYTNDIRLDADPNRIIGVMALIQDITEMRKLETMRTEFVANVSHELKTPLTSISGFIETLKNGAIDDEKVRGRFLDIIEIETERLFRLIEDLLSLSDIEHNRYHGKKDKIIISEAVKEANTMIESFIKQKRICYETELEEKLPPIYGNRDWFKQMLLNLIDNAVKYTPEGGTIKTSVYRRADNIFIAVKDTGIGIPKEDISRLFERFYRVDKARSRKVGGTGLGLAIVKHIVLSFNGQIRVNSKVGKGSEFIVRIPIQ